MDTPNDIRVELYLTDRQLFSSELIRYYLQKVEKAIYRAELVELRLLENTLPEKLGPIFDAVRYRAERFQSRTFYVDKVSTGSLLLSGVAAGVTMWVFDKTFGEAFKEAWKTTDLHANMVEILSRRVNIRAENIASGIDGRREPFLGPIDDRAWPEAAEPHGRRDDVHTFVSEENGFTIVRVHISVNEGRFPTVSEAIE
ncbi:hypothetical protein [Janthinobacterium sp. UMAB-60]|uniref:hypothetical protein n=1 Tax=Janthinobacterium sp. UMAB-60 TaxID=1365365 RepID=UPI001C56F20C|nr:hypothetical protein [Janthinobacterium sp. UMAB-60]